MSALSDNAASVREAEHPGLTAEWLRIELLSQAVLDDRRGRPLTPDLQQRLEAMQPQVSELRRAGGPWWRIDVDGLPALAFDILACILAAEAEPRIGWQYQEIQGGSQPFATPALIRLLLVLDEAETRQLYDWVGSAGELRRRGLIESAEQESSRPDGVFTPLRPTRAAAAALFGWRLEEISPPGAVRVRQPASWDDLILPPERERMLREYLLWLRHREQVVEQWGGLSMGGPVALFCGPSGTGKTYAASVIAAELGWPLYRVDLAALVSKYIGETEKNLGRLFDAADGRAMVLLFDEVDAVMSRRGEIREARDRYANMEVSYLLARMESHHGPCILTTNLRQQIDKAFFRRFQMVVEFPRPDAACRARLWQRMLPPRAPLGAGLDYQTLAGAVNLTGGNIRNAALHAAYLAAAEQQPIDRSHIAVAVWRELAKEKPHLQRSDLGALADSLPAGIWAEDQV
ncbi:MAG: hypothetical protein Tsb002_21200 [Wenzhouxiangellaceae bacterium]